MATDQEGEGQAPRVRNMGAPHHLKELKIDAVAAESAQEGENLKLWVRMAIPSDAPQFHRVVDNLVSCVEASAIASECPVNLRSAHTILIILHVDYTAELWVDAAALSIHGMMKRDMEGGSFVFENDIADVTGMDFPLVEIGESDRVICLFREGWRFGLFFDFNHERKFDREAMQRSLGDLHRTLRYRHLYDIMADNGLLAALIKGGWFPFVEITGEFKPIAEAAAAGFDLADAESVLLDRFDQIRLERMFTRWMAKPHFAGKEALLRSALNTFLSGEPAAVIKIALTEIEGILAEFHRATHGRGARLKRLRAFAIETAERKAGGSDTLLFPAAFGHYLNEHTFADFDPANQVGHAGSRHAVGHGAADTDSYTQVRALQALLTLDQLCFYT